MDELETDEVPDSLVADFSSLTTPYCWVITEDAVAGYDGAEPSSVGKFGPGGQGLGNVLGDCTTRAARTNSRRWTISGGRTWAR